MCWSGVFGFSFLSVFRFCFPCFKQLTATKHMSPKLVFKNKWKYNLYCHKVMRVLLLERKKEKEKKGQSQSYFLALHFGLYSLLFVCFNKHTRTSVQKNFKLCCKFMFRQILSSNCLEIEKAFLVEANGLKVCQCWPRATVSPRMPSNPFSTSLTCSVCVVTYFILFRSFLMSKNQQQQIGVLNLLSMQR